MANQSIQMLYFLCATFVLFTIYYCITISYICCGLASMLSQILTSILHKILISKHWYTEPVQVPLSLQGRSPITPKMTQNSH